MSAFFHVTVLISTLKLWLAAACAGRLRQVIGGALALLLATLAFPQHAMASAACDALNSSVYDTPYIVDPPSGDG